MTELPNRPCLQSCARWLRPCGRQLRRDAAQHETGWKAINLRTQFHKIITRAGLITWPRLWVNLRGSCETGMVQHFPTHVTAAWLGHTPDIAQQHYLQVLPTHLTDAVSGKAACHGSESTRTEPHISPEKEKSEMRGFLPWAVGDRCPFALKNQTFYSSQRVAECS